MKERYRSPPRRNRAKISGTTYTGPHRASHKVAAIVESSSEENSRSPTTKKGRKPKAERQKGTEQEVAAMNNRTTPWPPREQASRSTPTPASRRPPAPPMAQKPPGGEMPGLISSLPLILTVTNAAKRGEWTGIRRPMFCVPTSRPQSSRWSKTKVFIRSQQDRSRECQAPL